MGVEGLLYGIVVTSVEWVRDGDIRLPTAEGSSLVLCFDRGEHGSFYDVASRPVGTSGAYLNIIGFLWGKGFIGGMEAWEVERIVCTYECRSRIREQIRSIPPELGLTGSPHYDMFAGQLLSSTC